MTTREELVGLAERIVNAPTGWLPTDGEVKNITFLPSELTLIVAALRLASRQEVSVMPWQEITEENEPPRDVELLLGWWRDWPTRGWECAAGLWGSTNGGWNHGQATHWMPLPVAPPITKREG